MCERENVVFLRGNHDYTAMRILRCLFNPVSLFDDNEQVPTIQQWALDGGSTTLDQFMKMSSEDKKKVLTFLWNSKTYAEIEVNLIEEQSKGRIYQKNKHIAVDCGAVFRYPLGCICLDISPTRFSFANYNP